jgi:hypothetical protein
MFSMVLKLRWRLMLSYLAPLVMMAGSQAQRTRPTRLLERCADEVADTHEQPA